MGDLLKYRFPGKKNVNKKGEFISLDNLTDYKGFLISSFDKTQFFGFKESDAKGIISYSIKEPVCYSSEEYSLIAHIKTTHTFAGEAKTQIWAVTHLQPLLIKNPKYTLRCELRHLQSNKVVYKCTLEHKNQEIIYNQIQECIDNLNKIIAWEVY